MCFSGDRPLFCLFFFFNDNERASERPVRQAKRRHRGWCRIEHATAALSAGLLALGHVADIHTGPSRCLAGGLICLFFSFGYGCLVNRKRPDLEPAVLGIVLSKGRRVETGNEDRRVHLSSLIPEHFWWRLETGGGREARGGRRRKEECQNLIVEEKERAEKTRASESQQLFQRGGKRQQQHSIAVNLRGDYYCLHSLPPLAYMRYGVACRLVAGEFGGQNSRTD